MSPTKKILIGVGVLLVVLVGAALALGGEDEGVEVETSQARVRTITQTVTASGTVASEVEVPISSDVSGEIVFLAVEEGDRVERGQLLLRIRPDVYASQAEQARTQIATAQSGVGEAQSGVGEARNAVVEANQAIEQARSDLARATAERQRAERALARQQDLFDRDVAPAMDLEAARGAFEVAQASEASARQAVAGATARVASAQGRVRTAQGRVRSAQTQVEGARVGARQAGQQLAQTAIYAPLSGTVSQLNVELGERIVGTATMSGTPLMTIARLDAMTVEIDVNENDVIHVALGDSARVDVDAYPEARLPGTVVQIANSARVQNEGTAQAITNFPVVVRLAAAGDTAARRAPQERQRRSPGAGLRPGMSGTVEVFTRSVPSAVVVPISAVTARDLHAVERERRELAEALGEDVPETEVPEGEDIRRVVFVVVDGKAEMREVTTGINDDTHTEIRSGLTGGETVITGPFRLLRTDLKDGDRVTSDD